MIDAHKEFSPPKLGLITEKQNRFKARLPSPAESWHGFAVITIKSFKLKNSLSSSSLGAVVDAKLNNEPSTRINAVLL